MNSTATYIAAQTARQIRHRYSRQIWLDHKLELIWILNELQPSKPDDGSAGFLAYNVPGHNRMKMRTGRFLTRKLKLNSGLLPDTAIQHIANQINTRLFDDITIIRLDKGPQITQNYKNMIGGYSCMTGNAAQYTGLYADNPDKIRQLVMISLNDSARAIVYKLDNGEFYMSRVYSTSEDLKQCMRNYANKQGWYYSDCGVMRNGKSIGNYRQFIMSGLNFTDGEIPYVDVLSYYRIENGKLTMLRPEAGEFEGQLDSTTGYLHSDSECECVYCGCPVSQEDAYLVDDDRYCEECYDELFSRCEECGDVYPVKDCTWIQSTEKTVCETCLSDCYFFCDDCGKFYPESDLHRVSVDREYRHVCENCVGDYVICDDCEDYYPDGSLHPVDDEDKYVCEDCVGDYIACDRCGELFSDTAFTIIKDEYFCEDCAKAKKNEDCEGQLLSQTK